MVESPGTGQEQGTYPDHGYIDGNPTFVITNVHKRRINAEEKAKVVTAVWGTESIQFLAAKAILH